MNYIYQYGPVFDAYPMLLAGLWVTLRLTFEVIVGSSLIGLTGAAIRTIGPHFLRPVVATYVEIFRNTPLLIQVFVVYFSSPSFGLPLEPFEAARLALSLHGGAFLTEIIRSGTLSVSRGQEEAAQMLGLSRWKIYRYITIPQALRSAFPAITGEFILLLLGTSVCSAISTEELTLKAASIESLTFRSVEVYSVLLVAYLGLSIALATILKGIEKILFRWTT